ncbi:MAG: N-acetylmuramoyl-L-alanine amidase, partial [Oscillospiraceae bacterium]|nr:N-acetylmuramoyl-L-alanine amidase [Oscillospiraceae bacterium]
MKTDPKKEKRAAPVLRFALLILAVLMLTLALSVLFLSKNDDNKTGQMANGDEKTAAVIYLDPGHGDFDFGAVATLPDGSCLAEKDLVLSLAVAAADELRARGHTVHLSRTTDE